MISPVAMEQGCAGTMVAPAPEPDERVSLVLSAADFSHWHVRADGTRIGMFRLRKPWNGYPAGALLSLEQLHAILFPPKFRAVL